MSNPIEDMLLELQGKKLPKGALSANCDLELRVLLTDINQMMSAEMKKWEKEKDGIQSRLTLREKECQMHKSTLEQKHQEIGQLRQQLDNSENKQRVLVEQYESQLLQMTNMLENLKREYDRLHKQLVKHKNEAQREKEKSGFELQDGMLEVQKLNKKLEEYRQKSKDWDFDRKTLQKQIESLEAHRKAIADKCEFAQQQVQTYLLQLDKRREILVNTEYSLNAQIAQLQAKLSSTTESLNIQNSKVDKLKATLAEAISAHQKAMNDNEKLLNDQKKYKVQVRKLEDENKELLAELQAKVGFLKMAEEDGKQHAHDIELLRKQISEKDDIIKRLSNTKNRAEDEKINSQRKHLMMLEDQVKLFKRNESLSVQEIKKLQEELNTKKDAIDNLNKKLDQKITTGVCSNAGILDERTEELEKKLKSEIDLSKKMEAELQVANAQIKALHLENHHLQQTIKEQTQLNLDHTETESQLRENLGIAHLKADAIEQENITLKCDVSVLQQELSSMEEQYDGQLQSTVHESELSYAGETSLERRRLHETKEDSPRRISMLQNRRDPMLKKHDEILQLGQQMLHLEDDPERERRAGSSFQNTEFVFSEDDEGVMYMNEDMSLLETESVNDIRVEMLPFPYPMKFLFEEQVRTMQLEDIINTRIEQLSSSTDLAIKKTHLMRNKDLH